MREKRFALIDALRGLALLNMLAMHFLYDVNVVFGREPGWYLRPGVHLWQQYICWSFLLVHPSALECLLVPLTQTKANTTGIYPGAPLLSSLLTAPPCVKCGQPQDFTPPSLGFLFHLIWFWGCVLHPLKSVSFPGAPLLCLTPGPQ